MADYYCRICNVRKVSNPGDVCANCQDPYQEVSPVSDNRQVFISDSDTASEPSYQDTNDSSDYASSPLPGGKNKRRIMGAPAVSDSAPSDTRAYTTPAQPIQNAPVIPSMQTTAANAPSAASKQKATVQGPQTEGVVRNIVEGKDPSGFLARWFRSFVNGTFFPMTDDQTEFQVFSNWQSGSNAQGYAADKVIVYGHMQSHKPVQDNTVRVYGRRNKNNAIIADAIENTTDGTKTEFQPAPLPAMMVKVITLIVLALLILLIVAIFSGLSGLNGVGSAVGGLGRRIGNFAVQLLLTVVAGLATYYCGSKAIKLLAHGGDGSSILMYAIGTFIAGSAFVSFISSLL